MAGSQKDILQVARLAGVSPATVSRALNHPDIVKPETRKAILKVVDQIGYIPNRAATTIHRKNSDTIGLVIPTIDTAIFSRMIRGFSRRVEKEGYMTMIANHDYDLNREQEIVHRLIEHRVDGIAWVGIDHTEMSMRMLKQHRLPCVSLWNFHQDHPIPCIGVDNYQVGCVAAQHLIDLGHTDIAIISARLFGNDRARQRYDGASDTLHKAGLRLPEMRDITSPYNIAETKKRMMDILSQPHPPTAVVCGNDVQAYGVIYAAQTLGVQIPEQLSIVGVGNLDVSAEINPTLSTIAIPATEIGNDGAEILFDRIAEAEATTIDKGQPTEEVEQKFEQLSFAQKAKMYHKRLEVKLIVRQTSAPPAG